MILVARLCRKSPVCPGFAGFKFTGTCLERYQDSLVTQKGKWGGGNVGKRDRWKESLSQGYSMGARAASLPLAQPHPLYNVCFISMFIKHHRINTFLHFREMTSSSVLNDGSSFEKCKEKKLWGIIKGHKMYF